MRSKRWISGALACVCLLTLHSCAPGSGGRGRGSSKVASSFPSRSEVDALTRGSGAINPFAQAVVDADTWTFTEPVVERLAYVDFVDPSPWGKILSDYAASEPSRLKPTASMHCAAREFAYFYVKYAAMPAAPLRRAIGEHCGALAEELQPHFVFGPAEPDKTEAMLHYAWKPQVRQRLEQYGKAGPRDLGIAFARDDKKAVVVVLTGPREVELQPVSRVVGADGTLVLRGRALVPADVFGALVNQGRYGFAVCEGDANVRPPDFAFTCKLAPGDQSASANVSAHRTGRIFGEGLLSVALLRDATQRPYRRVTYTNEALISSQSQLPERLLGLVNEVRRQASVKPVTLSTAESATAEKLAPMYFEAFTDPEKQTAAELIILGLLAGWDVDAPIRDAGFTHAAVGPTRDASEWISAVLAAPSGRAVILDPNARVVAFGPVLYEAPPVIGSIFTSYALFEADSHVGARKALLEKLGKDRAARGLPAPVLVTTLDADAAALASQVNAGAATPTDVLEKLLQTSAEVLGRSVHGMYFEATDIESIEFPDEMLTAKRLELSVTVTHYKPEDEPWGRFVILLVIPGEGTQA